ncbi:TonB-dependent receptor [Sphingobium sp. TA15]|uniref:TonB-dependent receptor-like protein n=2 Tax=Sphingobium indicum TaxID=332055 RepID=D4Z8A5_SPHIU|nr:MULTISPECIES: TonB-dependent receptor [Sphingobium]EPR15246.1 TonB-denpendent receptor [Sphingobium indicum IP26]BDD68774.1 TonB-dependent receptor [Sphingobium sp. TA15]EQB03018.1 TonB-denpendent receptor [Sphingobium sp. HDIP04]KER34914.1 TonB-dependent receptor [Sphingobium indicum F2]KER35517.1 TonB-dependent receptor [Sphingobium indicum F2]
MTRIFIRKRTGFLLGAAMAGLIAPSVAQAEEASKSAPPAAEGGGRASAPASVIDIVVTAQRESQSLQSVPISVSAFTAETLQRQQIDNSLDLQLSLPNTIFTKNNFSKSSFTIRGIGDLCVGSSCDSATGITNNELPLFDTRLFEVEYFDLERVEVLRGPQGTLFGRNATSGVVNFITAKPDLNGVHASGEIEYGNYDSRKVKGMLNLPLTQSLGARFAGIYVNRDGYTKNLHDGARLDGRDIYAVRASLRWEPSSSTTIDLLGYYFHEKDNRLRIQKQKCLRDPTGVLGCLPGRLGNDYTNNNATFGGTLTSREYLTMQGGPGIGALALGSLYGPDSNLGNPLIADPRTVNTDFHPTFFSDEIQAQLRIEHDFGPVTLKVSGQYQRTRTAASQDYNLSVNNAALFLPGLSTLQAYGNGVAGPSLAQFGRVAAALIPNGPAGPYCTSIVEPSATGAFGGHSLCSATPQDFDRTSLFGRAFTGEAIVASKFDGPFNFLVGGIYSDYRNHNADYNVNAFNIDYAAGVLGVLTSLGQQGGQAAAGQPVTYPTVFLASPYVRNNSQLFQLKSYGLFGEAYFEPNDRLKLTAGLRYNHDDKSNRARNTIISFPVPYGTANAFDSPFFAAYDADAGRPGIQPVQQRDATFGEFTGRAVIDFQVTPRNLLYASYSRGYKSGGINPPLLPIFNISDSFEPEFVNALEVGSKNSFLGGSLRLNASAFYYQYKGLQLSRIVSRTSVNDNVDADIYGIELEAIARPIPALTVNINASYLHTKVSSDRYITNPRDPSGGRSDAVIVKDISNGSNCTVVPNTAGNSAASNNFVNFVNGEINAGRVVNSSTGRPLFRPGAGLQGTTPFPADSGLNGATGAYSICSALASYVASAGAGPSGVSVLTDGVPVNLRGNRLPQAPDFKVSAGAQYVVDMGTGGSTLVPRVDVILTGGSYGSVFNGNANRIPSYVIVNAQLQLNGRDDRWFVRAFVQNLTDSNAITGLYVSDQPSGLFTNIFTLEPRRYGIAAGVNF